MSWIGVRGIPLYPRGYRPGLIIVGSFYISEKYSAVHRDKICQQRITFLKKKRTIVFRSKILVRPSVTLKPVHKSKQHILQLLFEETFENTCADQTLFPLPFCKFNNTKLMKLRNFEIQTFYRINNPWAKLFVA